MLSSLAMDRNLTRKERPMEPNMRPASAILAELAPSGPARLAYVRRAPAGLGGDGGTLLCLSASFNPMTTAHAALIGEASRLIPPGEVLLLLAVANVDKAITGVPLAVRLDLLRRFAESRPTVSVAAVGHGRFVDKLEAIRTAYPAGTRLVFLLGFDTLVRLFEPKYYTDPAASLSRLFEGSECVVANRAPEPLEAIAAFLARADVAPFADRIRVIRLSENLAAVSATAVRARLARGEPVAGLVPPEIAAPLEAAWHRVSAPTAE
jgi:nicotinic acid mononucleotide adenylyltransferase